MMLYAAQRFAMGAVAKAFARWSRLAQLQHRHVRTLRRYHRGTAACAAHWLKLKLQFRALAFNQCAPQLAVRALWGAVSCAACGHVPSPQSRRRRRGEP